MKTKIFYYFILMFFVLKASVLFTSCSNNDEDNDVGKNNMNEVSVTSKVDIIDLYSATLWGYANGATGKIGVCISATTDAPNIENAKTIETTYINSDNSYCVTAKDLKTATKYYYRAFAQKDNLIYYSKDIRTFTIYFQGEAVDLGLSVKWASCNVGATKPEEIGNLYSWGETSVKELYDTPAKKAGTYDPEIDRKYNFAKTRLDQIDDAAYVNWGSSWRMPTAQEIQELINECNWTYTKRNGIAGYNVVSKKNSNSIFIPIYSSLYGYNIWSNDMRTESTHSTGFAKSLFTTERRVELDREVHRAYGLPVRGVKP